MWSETLLDVSCQEVQESAAVLEPGQALKVAPERVELVPYSTRESAGPLVVQVIIAELREGAAEGLPEIARAAVANVDEEEVERFPEVSAECTR